METDHCFLSPKGENLSPKRENAIAVEGFATRGERYGIASAVLGYATRVF
jgi:hypothetical protein